MSDVYWCKNCNAPLLTQECGLCKNSGYRIASDIRPVFCEEKRLLEILLEFPNGHLKDKSVWDTSGNLLLIDGEKIKYNKSKLLNFKPEEIRVKLEQRSSDIKYDEIHPSMELFVRCNKQRLNIIEIEAFDIIKKARELYANYEPIVSFSGGKDSTVTSDLVRKAYQDRLVNRQIVHTFQNTTIELPETVEPKHADRLSTEVIDPSKNDNSRRKSYITRFKKKHNKTPFVEMYQPHRDFLDLCNEIGPPSRVMRWCCTIFKTGPIGRTFDGLIRVIPSGHILTFYGVRRSESNKRAKYEPITRSPKLEKQVVVSPIINWTDADVWLYILSNELDFNDAYRLGFSRVGCWACPNNSLWAFFLTRVYHPELSEPWRNYLIKAASEMGKPDAEQYVDSGNWKARQGGQGLKTAFKGIVTSKACGDDPYAKTYTLTKSINKDLYEYFKPFGHVEFSKGNSRLGEVFVEEKHKEKSPIMVLQGTIGSNDLRVKIINHKNPTLLLKWVDCQIRKYQSCVLCGGCPFICPARAISDKNQKYSIDEQKCINCNKCISHYDTGCLASKVLQTRRGKNA